ncbi:MAG TPA: hypothetical protein DEA69_05965 [Microbacterium sp.]|uniref:YdhK family protein n=1 Tax=Microbacterium sp. UBA1097 TaxID=1946941 RepID=UPI000E8273E4|nr:YdhK family protein [Microbacterium sp. UBA1097]HBS08330.1 hypothetical protein [Microbacterium sp.]HBS75045.1 hypothetical protein [Microbacterium sp.]HBU41817.1 hypothetical protein [Microbacterium sp.]HCM50896.1 hypothetical protein [Microbacterium sp.]|tara:strand:- start:5440 stop:6057 length:618 start_codon:yes stop_codon:yes gene_type:complete
MNAAGRLALFGGGLVVAFGAAYGLAGVIVPDSFVQSWTERSDMNEHGADSGDHAAGSGHSAHDHPADGGPAPAGIQDAIDPTYPVGSRVILSADHMPGMDGAEATVSGAFTTTAYAVSYTPTTGGEPVTDHRWVVHEELENPGRAPLADGAQAVLLAEHMTGMKGADAAIDYSTDETVYMVDLDADGMRMTNHKWVVESEMQPAH